VSGSAESGWGGVPTENDAMGPTCVTLMSTDTAETEATKTADNVQRMLNLIVCLKIRNGMPPFHTEKGKLEIYHQLIPPFHGESAAPP
jgi:hypothetical protein